MQARNRQNDAYHSTIVIIVVVSMDTCFRFIFKRRSTSIKMLIPANYNYFIIL